MLTFLQVLVAGLLTGSLYGLLSSGLSLSFGVTRIVNFAHGDFVTVGMYTTVLAVTAFGSFGLLLLPVVALIVGALGMGMFVLLLSRTAVSGASELEIHIPQIVITAAASVFIQSLLLFLLSSRERTAKTPLAGSLRLGEVSLPYAQLAAFVVGSLVFVILDRLVRKSEFGRALRAVVDDGDAAAIVGINSNRIFAASFLVGTAMAGLVGGLLVTYQPVTPTTGANYLALAFVTVILGGLGSIRGSFIAGIIIGVVQQVTATYVALDLKNEAVWLAFIVILLVRPQGLFGKKVMR